MRHFTLTPSCHLVQFRDGTEVLFSFGQPIAAKLPDRGYVVAEGEKSKGSTKHVHVYLRGTPEVVPQTFLDEIGEQTVPSG